jgi:hypothetical protein
MAVIRGTDLVDIYSTDVEAPTFRRVLERAQGVASELLDRLTDDGNASHVNHAAVGRGAPLSLQYAAQYLGAGVGSTSPGVGKDGGSGPSIIGLWPWLVYVPPGETALCVDVECAGITPSGVAMRAFVTDFATAQATAIRDENEIPDRRGVYRGILPVAGDTMVAVYVCAYGGEVNPFERQIVSVAIHPGRADVRPLQRVDSPIVAATRIRSRAPGASEALRFREFDDTELVDDHAIGGHHVGWIDSNLNTLEQFATGLPAGGTSAYTATEDALSDPTRDRYAASTRKTFADEPIVRIPLLSHCFGGYLNNVQDSPDIFGGMTNHSTGSPQGWPGGFAPWLNEVVKTKMSDLSTHFPDYSANAKGAALFVSPLSSPPSAGDFTAYVQCGASAEQSAVLSSLGAGLYLAEWSSVPYPRDEDATVSVSLERTTGGDAHQMALCSLALWIDP